MARKPARAVALVNQKGGVAKTTSALALAAEAAVKGLRVAIIDMDPQANATEAVEPVEPTAGIKDVLREDSEVSLGSVLVATSWPGVMIAPAERALANRESDLAEKGAEFRLREALDDVAGDYDLFLLDCPPSLGNLTVTALCAATDVLIPTAPRVWAAKGVGQLRTTVAKVKKNYVPDLREAGIIITQVDGTREAGRIVDELRAAHPGMVWEPVIPKRVAVTEAFETYRCPLRDLGRPEAVQVADAYAEHLAHLLA